MEEIINKTSQRRVLVIPDAWHGNASGAIVAQELVRHLKKLNCKVGVFSCDIRDDGGINDDLELFTSLPFSGWTNIAPRKALNSFIHVVNNFNPTHLFFVGSITNKPLCYLEEGLRRSLHINVFIFMQDFFCYKYYANTIEGPCRKCLDKGMSQCIKNHCEYNTSVDFLKQIIGIRTRCRLQKLLKKVDRVITSSDEQVKYYEDFGISSEKIMKIPLLFDRSRLVQEEITMGDYYIGIAQNRIEKGFHLMPKILANVSNSAKILLAYYNEEATVRSIKENNLQAYIDQGVLEVRGLTWSNGLGKAISQSRGVIIPSIWPTTTEFGLLEALGLGKPVFTYAVGIHREIFQNGENGYTFEIGDEKSFGQTLSSFTKSDYDRVSEGALQLYNHLTDEEMWQDLIDCSLR